MTEPLTPVDKLFSFLKHWSQDYGTLLTPDVWLRAHAQTEKTIFIEELVSIVEGQNDFSEALEKLCWLADITQCSLVVLTTSANESFYSRFGFVWYRGNTKDVWKRRPQTLPS